MTRSNFVSHQKCVGTTMAVEVFPTATGSDKRNLFVTHNGQGQDVGSESDASSASSLSNATYNYYNWHYNYHQHQQQQQQQHYPMAQQDWTHPGTENQQVQHTHTSSSSPHKVNKQSHCIALHHSVFRLSAASVARIGILLPRRAPKLATPSSSVDPGRPGGSRRSSRSTHWPGQPERTTPLARRPAGTPRRVGLPLREGTPRVARPGGTRISLQHVHVSLDASEQTRQTLDGPPD